MEERNGDTPPPPPRAGGHGDERRTEVLLAALKEALIRPGEHRLFKSGKLAGLFPSRAGAAGEAATLAVRDGLLETVRTETRGKTAVEWVRLTPRGVDFLHAHDSPRAVLRELRATLGAARAGVPLWLEEMTRELQDFTRRCAAKLEEIARRLDALDERVENALRRAEAAGPAPPDPAARLVPWGLDALTYLDQRKESGAGDCPLPELFAALRRQHPDLSVTAFHDGLRRLHDLRAIRLSPGEGGELREPEYALLDGARMLYYAGR
ncbi:MAG TPA: hypothetical protein VIL46_13715 [Gemmataceae bacterium]